MAGIQDVSSIMYPGPLWILVLGGGRDLGHGYMHQELVFHQRRMAQSNLLGGRDTGLSHMALP